MQKYIWLCKFGRSIAALCTFSLLICGLFVIPACAEASPTPKQLPLFEVKEYYDFSDHVDELLQAFYGDDWTSLEPKVYKGLHIWVAENNEAKIEDDRFSLRRYGSVSYFLSNLPGVRLSPEAQRDPGEKIIDQIPGRYTYLEAQEFVNAFMKMTNLPWENNQISYVSSEDPTMKKEKSHYYYMCFVPVYAGIPILEDMANRLSIRACVTDEGLVEMSMNSIPKRMEEVGRVTIINPSKISLKNLGFDHQKMVDDILCSNKDVLEVLSNRELFASDGTVYTRQITSLTPEWSLYYVIIKEGEKVLMKPVWQFTAEEYQQYEIECTYVLFDAQTGMEVPI